MKCVAEFDAIGTHWSIDLPKTLDAKTVSSVLHDVRDCIDRFDAVYSRFRSDSLVSAIAKVPGVYQFPLNAIPLFSWYRTLYDVTHGAVTPLIGNALSDAGYDAEYSFIEKPMTSPPTWDDAMAWDPKTCCLTTRLPVLLDFGAAGKGYCVDRVVGVLRSHGVRAFCCDAGGDIAYANEHGIPMTIGLEHPFDETKAIGTARILKQSLCGSAGNRRAWGRFHHTLNPFTLESPRDLAAIWVVASTTMIADGLTTALQFTSPELLATIAEFEYAVLNPDLHYDRSEGFPGEIFTKL
jgi:thiamine biosynthesis lipoprotein